MSVHSNKLNRRTLITRADMSLRFAVVTLATASLSFGHASGMRAQIRASERGTVSQTVDGTTITLDYGRPQTRGRTNLYGGEVPWGKVWTPGANWATNITVDKDITIDGHTLAKGQYSVWLQVHEDSWTAIFDPEPRRFHLMPPPEADNQVRFTVHSTEHPHVEVLTWSFPVVRPTGTTLQMAWGDAAVTFDIGVQSSRDVTVSADLAERIVGSYRLALGPQLGGGEVAFDIRYENRRLVATWENPPNPRLGELWLLELGAGMFTPAELERGEIFDIVVDMVLEFTPLEGRADKFEMRVFGDELWGTGTRQ